MMVLAVYLKLLTLQLYSTWNFLISIDRYSSSALKYEIILLKTIGLLVKKHCNIALLSRAFLVEVVSSLLMITFILVSFCSFSM
jgi:hypothetical protein